MLDDVEQIVEAVSGVLGHGALDQGVEFLLELRVLEQAADLRGRGVDVVIEDLVDVVIDVRGPSCEHVVEHGVTNGRTKGRGQVRGPKMGESMGEPRVEAR